MVKLTIYQSSKGNWVVRKVIKATANSEIASKKIFSSRKKAIKYMNSFKKRRSH